MAKMTGHHRPFIPALPTLWPKMLVGGRRSRRLYPFNDSSVRYFYFARNAIWLLAKGLKLDGGEILVPAYHHGVEIEALVDAGAQVSFYRVGRRWDVDLEDVERRINSRTKALYLVHYAGFPGPVDAMKALAVRHGIPLIEDCALSLLSANGSKPLGSTGDAGIFCLYKTLPLPNGGAFTLNSTLDARNMALPTQPPPATSTFSHVASSLLQNLEMRGGALGRWVRGTVRGLGRSAVEMGNIERVTTGSDDFNREDVNLGMSSLSQRILAYQNLQRVVAIRRRNYRFLLEQLGDVSPPLFDGLAPGVCPLFYPLVVKDKQPLMEYLSAQGIETIDFWRFSHPACDPSLFPDVAWLRSSILEIPCHQDLTLDAMAYIAGEVRAGIG